MFQTQGERITIAVAPLQRSYAVVAVFPDIKTLLKIGDGFVNAARRKTLSM